MSDFADDAAACAEAFVSDCLARRTTAPLAPRPDGRCLCCGERIPEARRMTGAATCIGCQIRIESGEMAP